MKRVYSVLIEKNCRPVAQSISDKHLLYSLLDDLLEVVAHFDFYAARQEICKASNSAFQSSEDIPIEIANWILKNYGLKIYVKVLEDEHRSNN